MTSIPAESVPAPGMALCPAVFLRVLLPVIVCEPSALTVTFGFSIHAICEVSHCAVAFPEGRVNSTISFPSVIGSAVLSAVV